MTKLLHTADIHLDAPLRSLALRDPGLRELVQAATRGAFTRLIDVALDEQVVAILIAGDLFDGASRSARSAAFLAGQFDRLKQAGIRVFYIKGNHDAENPITGAIDLPDNVHVFDARGGKVALGEHIWVHGVSFADRHAPDSLLPRFPPPVPGAVNIAMLHTSLSGAAGHDPYAPCSVAELTSMGFDYWALGHVHKRQIHARDPWVVMPGMPQGRDIGEAGPKSATLITVTDGRIDLSEVATSRVEFMTSVLDISGTESDDDLRQMMRHHLGGLAGGLGSDTGVLRLCLTGRTQRQWHILRDRYIWSESAAAIAQETGRLWLDKLVIDIAEPDAAEPGATASDELAALMAQIAREPGFAASARAELDDLLDDLPPSLRAALLSDAEAAATLATESATNGAKLVLARLKGAEG